MNRLHSLVFLALLLHLIVGCTEHRNEIDMEFPDYKPTLVVLAGASPLSGAQAIIKWSVPLKGQKGDVPNSPDLSLFLLENNERKTQFNKDSIGFFSIKPENIKLLQNKGYSLEIVLNDSNKSIFSDESYLPAEPVIKDVHAHYISQSPPWLELTYTQMATTSAISGISIATTLIGGSGNSTEKPSYLNYLNTSSFIDTEGIDLPETKRTLTLSGELGMESHEAADTINLKIAYLSKELTTFKNEVDQLDYMGESIFQTVKPVFSNINGASGVFGLYNELSDATVILKENNSENRP